MYNIKSWYNMKVKCPECGHEIEVNTHKSRKFLWIVLVVVLVFLAGAAYGAYYLYQQTLGNSEQSAYENAIQSTEPAVLQNFLDIHVAASQAHRDTVAARLERLKRIDQLWTNVVRSKSKAEIRKYIQLYPQSVHVIEARLLIDSLDWVLAENINTVESYKTYLDNHSDGLYYDVAKVNYDNLSNEAKLREATHMVDSLKALMQKQQEEEVPVEQP